MKEYVVAIVGATGSVGKEIALVLKEQNFPIERLVPLASKRSVEKTITFGQKEVKVLELTKTVFKKQKVEIAFFSAGGNLSAVFAPYAVKAGAVVIDNTSYFRMQKEVPLVVPEVNPQDIALWKNTGIIANPNCSTIQMVTALKPLYDAFKIKRIDVSTYQAVSGAGKSGMEELVNQLKDFFNFKMTESSKDVFFHQIAFNCIPQIDIFNDENDYTKEELKMMQETNKILHANLEVSATCVRVPVLRSHSESITVEFETDAVNKSQAIEAFKNGKNLEVIDNKVTRAYPMPVTVTDTDTTFVGRVRQDLHNEKKLHFWCVADQIRVGAATNAVHIAQEWIKL